MTTIEIFWAQKADKWWKSNWKMAVYSGTSRISEGRTRYEKWVNVMTKPIKRKKKESISDICMRIYLLKTIDLVLSTNKNDG
jgi:hypothetical protein